MVRITDSKAVVSDEVMYVEYMGESTDEKPDIFGQTITIVNGQQVTKDVAIATGSIFMEVDTHDVYLFSEEDGTWNKIVASDNAIAEEVARQLPGQVGSWLDAHISNPDSPPLDRTLSYTTAAAPADIVGGLKSALKQQLDYVRKRTYNLLDMTSIEGWVPASGKDVSIELISENVIRVKNNVSQTYGAALYYIDVSGVNTIYAKYGGYSGTGTQLARIYGVTSSMTNLGAISSSGSTFDVSSYDLIAVEFFASTSTANSGYMDYYCTLVTTDLTKTAIIPYYTYEPLAEELYTYNQDILDENLRTRTSNLIDWNDPYGWKYLDPKKPAKVTKSGKDTLRITALSDSTYTRAYKIIDVHNISTIHAHFDSYSGTGASWVHLYSSDGNTYTTDLGAVITYDYTFDVSSYDYIAVVIASDKGTGGTGKYVDYVKMMITALPVSASYVPYYQYEPLAMEAKEKAEFDWLLYKGGDTAQYYNRCKNFPVYVRNGDVLHYNPGTGNTPFSLQYHIYSTYKKAMDSYNTQYGYVAGDVFVSDTYNSELEDVTINYSGWFMAIGRYSGDPIHMTPSDIPEEKITKYKFAYEKPVIEIVEYNEGNDIEETNQSAYYWVQNLKNRSKRISAGENPPDILSLLHFSDIHGSKANLERIVDVLTSLDSYIDDSICTGDMVASKDGDTSMDFWNEVSGAEKIMMVMGNHDVWKSTSTEFGPGEYITQAQAYARYIQPYVSNWGDVTYTADHTYYYKDYDDCGVRLICLDMMLFDTERATQLTWFESVLASARTAGLSVVIAEHYAPRPNTIFDCNFSAKDGYASTTAEWNPGNDYQGAVDDFVDAGGEFICWLAGHTHCDYVCYNANFPSQLFITITCALTSQSSGDQARVNGTKSQDAFNVIGFDTVTKQIKIIRFGADQDDYLSGRHALTINYETQEIVTQN